MLTNIERYISVFIFLSLLFTIIIFSKYDEDNGTIVRIESGLIRGHILKSWNGNNFWSFQEIPYAAPPLRTNRFQLPKSPDEWNGIKNTTQNTKICFQNSSRFPDLQISEDCLYINVYTPVKPGSSNNLIPVLIWIHGGGFISESGVYKYNGPKYIIDHGVVIVSFNYRLGAFGFLATDDGVIPSNLGIKDQIFAMRWVQKNINQFGGDNKRVTIIGESAGSASVGYHLINPWDDGVELFQAAIMQSGSPITGMKLKTNATVVAMNLAKIIDSNFSPKNTKELLIFLQDVDPRNILLTGITGINVAGPDWIKPYQSFLDGKYKKIPILIGFNSEELLFVQYVLTNKLLSIIDANPNVLISTGVNMSPENRLIAGKLYKDIYTNNSTFVQHHGSFVKYSSDTEFTTATCKQVELGSVKVPYYFYQFSYKGYLGGQMKIKPLENTERVIHAEDLHYMWEYNGFNSDLSKFPKTDQLTLHRVVKMWTNFAKYFNPTPEDDPLLDNVKWFKSEPKTLRYLNINVTLEMRENPRQYRFLKPILETYMVPPFNFFN